MPRNFSIQGPLSFDIGYDAVDPAIDLARTEDNRVWSRERAANLLATWRYLDRFIRAIWDLRNPGYDSTRTPTNLREIQTGWWKLARQIRDLHRRSQLEPVSPVETERFQEALFAWDRYLRQMGYPGSGMTS